MAKHDFYLLVGTAGAALLASLFVAVSLGTGYLTDERQSAIRPANQNRRNPIANLGIFDLGMCYRISFGAKMIHRKVMIVRV